MTITSTPSSGGVRTIVRATLVGLVLQLLLVFAGNRIPAVAWLFAPLGMLISLAAGWLSARWRPAGPTARAVAGGAIAGGVCAFLGILESFYLGDVPAAVLGFGTAMSAVTGAIGGWFGRRRAAW